MDGSRGFRQALPDPGPAAARARWLARGVWLLAAAEVVVAVRNHITGRLTDKERRRMVEIVRSSKGRPSNLSDRERKELRALLAKVEAPPARPDGRHDRFFLPALQAALAAISDRRRSDLHRPRVEVDAHLALDAAGRCRPSWCRIRAARRSPRRNGRRGRG